MIAAWILGAAVGAGLALAAFGLAPSPPPLATALAELHRRREPAVDPVVPAWLGRLVHRLGAERLADSKVAIDLAVTGHDISWYLGWAGGLALAGLAAGPVVGLVALGLGVGLPWGVPVGFSLIGGPGAVAAHVLAVHSEAAHRRESFTFALSAYLDLVVVSMAAGRGIEGALVTAARSGQGTVFDALRHALAAARVRGIAPWDGLDDLGERLGVDELRGLAASIRLAGTSGARIRESVAARARALRARGLADARAASESATEAMSVPVVLLVLGFIVLVGYPAVAQITAQL